MARDLTNEKERDLRSLDAMIARMERQAEEHDSPQVTALFAKELPKLLERRAALLGLDAPAGSQQPGDAGSIEAVKRRLEAVK